MIYIFSISLRYLFWTAHIENITVYIFHLTAIFSLYYSVENWIVFYSVAIVFHLVVEYYYSFSSQNYLLLCPYAISVCKYRWYMATSLSMSHVTTNKPRLYYEDTRLKSRYIASFCSEVSNNILSTYLRTLDNKLNLGTLLGIYSY